ncbi:unnamed protein product [Prunus armeniaca]
MEDVLLCECWVQISHCPVTGNEMKFCHMWRKILPNFVKDRVRPVRKWHCPVGGKFSIKSWGNREMPWQKRGTTIEVGKILAMRFRIIPTGSTVVLNETPLHDSPAPDSPLDSLMNQDSPIQKEPRPIGRKAAKAKRGSNSSSNTSKFLEEIVRQSAMRIEIDMKTQEDERAIQVEYAKEREYVCKENIERNDRETIAMDTSHMSLETKQFWKLEQTDVMRRRLFRDDGPSNTDWLNYQNH